MKEQLEQLLADAIGQIKADGVLPADQTVNIQLDRPRDKSHGDFATNLALMLAKPAKTNPRQLAETIVAAIPQNTLLAKTDIAGPGFINFTIAQDQLKQQLEAMMTSDRLGVEPAQDKRTIVIDYSSPNLAKEMHVGHLRSAIIGDAVSRVSEFLGHTVIRQNHVGDWGTQFGMLLAYMEALDNQEAEYELSNLETFYKAAKQRFDESPEFAERARELVVKLQSGDEYCLKLWNQFIDVSLSHCQEVYDRLGVKLTRADVMAESAYNDRLPGVIEHLKEKNLLVEDQGAQCVFLDEFKGKEGDPLPIIVQKKGGGYLYATTDLAAIQYRQQELGGDYLMYFVDARQALHFEQIFTLARKAGFIEGDIRTQHYGFGTVMGKDGKPYKSRDGGVTKLADLLDEAERRALSLLQQKSSDLTESQQQEIAKVVGISSVKYADLSKNRTSDYIFDWDLMLTFEGNTAPYLLYAFTRVNSIFSRLGETGFDQTADFILDDPREVALANQLVRFNEVVHQVYDKAMPHFLCGYLFELAGRFSSFYEACPILNQDNEALRNSRLKLARLTANTLSEGLDLLGIPTLEKM
ncbi:MAG: arginine--tRNA ligase [Idiomarina sp.]|uniref:arginine--tRNA ligase n=1 Tax=Idiomarina sp. TaxID=1874361 RepID=UPI000C0C59B5|nr:arginine--tRNA ligase [Idiomarina sp.]MAK72113.1 arginine--tRNA ligase [Idiomarinaceae bacterium]MBL4742201.1 arginine--tRNA ligase [Idiomarina sp.]MBT42178.1 arginine--tRNA ligase [Idiomarina sp.]PHQ77168.1 MAG: arginine--tRNA ligase [Idiomarina sp.]